MPFISIIVPVYKAEPFLRRCVESILAQTFTDFELILVDDGSPDNCGIICDDYAAKDSRVRVFHQENRGVSAARNLALDKSRGEKILFCDADDLVTVDWAEQLLEVSLRFPSSLCVCDCVRFSISDEQLDLSSVHQPSETIQLSYFELYKRGLSAYTCNKIYDNNVIKQNRLYFDESMTLSEDVVFNVQYLHFCSRIILIEEKLYCYRKTEGGASAQYRSNAFSDHIVPFSCRLSLLEEKDISEYCDIWFYQFCNLLDNVFDRRNVDMNLFQKLVYNQKMILSEEFTYCIEHASLRKENPILVSYLKRGNYLFYWLAVRLHKLKQKLMR